MDGRRLDFRIDPPLPWRPNALALLAAMDEVVREGRNYDLGNGLLRLTELAKPGHPFLIQALRHADVWPSRAALSTLETVPGVSRLHFVLQDLATESESIARRRGARSVGERHIVERLTAFALHTWGIHTANLSEAINVLELGPHFSPAELQGRWHGFVDANIVLQFNDLHQVDWAQEIGQKAITLWVAGTLLNELDDLQYSSGSRRVRSRAARFGAWIHPLMEPAITAGGTEIRPGVELRVWAPATSGLRDTDHLEAALELVERGVPLVLITQDMGMRVRALGQGLTVHRMSSRFKLPEEPTPAEAAQKLRLEAEGIVAPPRLSLRTDRSSTGKVLLYVDCAPDGGEAKSTTVRWYPKGGSGLDITDATRLQPLTQGVDGWIRQQLTAHLAPGTSDLIAEVINAPEEPRSFVYELRAEGSAVRRGELISDGQTYVEDPVSA